MSQTPLKSKTLITNIVVLAIGAAAIMAALLGWKSGDGPLADARSVTVQDNGRVKPLESFARESVRMVIKRSTYHGEDPLETVLRWSGNPNGVGSRDKLLRVEHAELRKALALPAEGETWATFDSVRDNKAYWKLIDSGAAKEREDRKSEVTVAERKAMELHGSFTRLGLILQGRLPRFVAVPQGEAQRWMAPSEVPPSGHPGTPVVDAWMTLARAVVEKSDLQAPASALLTASRAVGLEHQGDAGLVASEVSYFRLHPIGMALGLYLLGAILMLATLPLSKQWVPWLAAAPIAAAFVLHGYGMLTRVQISGRPPVTDMYESILWASWTVMFFAFILAAFLKVRAYVLVGSAVSWLLLAFTGTGLMPLDPAISPLVPVLRNNFWLTVHVPIIVASYGAFALAWGLGYVAMGYAAFAPQKRDMVNKMSRYIYRAMQIGVLFLGAGTILGGIWANESWGRYWGWDPKEVGALLAFLIYVAALHGRFAGWWHNFGLAVSAVLGFFGVLMAWIGVNILGAGLHAYGFSEGGMLPYVLVGLFIGSVGFCFWAWVARKNALANRPELAAAVQADIEAEWADAPEAADDDRPAAAKGTDTGGPAVA